MGLIWPDLAHEFIEIFSGKVSRKEEVLGVLKNIDISNYNQTTIEHKILIMQSLIEAAEDSNEFKSHHSTKSQSAYDLMKEKGAAQRK